MTANVLLDVAPVQETGKLLSSGIEAKLDHRLSGLVYGRAARRYTVGS